MFNEVDSLLLLRIRAATWQAKSCSLQFFSCRKSQSRVPVLKIQRPARLIRRTKDWIQQGDMSAANSWAAGTASPPPGSLFRPRRLVLQQRDTRHFIIVAPSHCRPALRGNRGPPALCCRHGDFLPPNTATGGGGIYSEWDWNRWSQHFSDTDQAESFSSLLKVSAILDSVLIPDLIAFHEVLLL